MEAEIAAEKKRERELKKKQEAEARKTRRLEKELESEAVDEKIFKEELKHIENEKDQIAQPSSETAESDATK